MRLLVAASIFAVAACSSSSLKPPGDDDDDGTPDAPSGRGSDGGVVQPDAPWTYDKLITSTWSMPLGSYGNFCASVPIADDTWIDAFELAAGTNPYNEHSIVYLTKNPPPVSCVPYLDSTAQVLYIAGYVGDGEFAQQRTLFPSGYGVHLQPTAQTGYYLAINSHIYNDPKAGSTGKISGSTEVDFHAATSTTLTAVDMALLGQFNIDVPLKGTYTATGDCNPVQSAGEQWNLVMIAPHMHDSGISAKLDVKHGGATSNVYSELYNPMQEATVALPTIPTLVATGDTLTTTCNYNNISTNNTTALNTDGETYPEDFTQTPTGGGGEICWAGVYKYPTGFTLETAAATSPTYACVVAHP